MEIFIKSYGAKLSKKEGMFLVETEEKSQPLPAGLVERIHIYPACSVTTDAVLLALENDIEIVLHDKRGTLKGYFWHGNNFSVAHIRQGQALFSVSADASLWIADLMKEKISNQAGLLEKVAPDQHVLTGRKQAACWDALLGSVREEDAHAKIRAAEARFARFYFSSLSHALPLPHQFKGRSKRPAKDPFNAVLNYAYAILYTKVEAALWRAGLDPYLGIFHANEYRTQALTFDLIEPFRPWVDEVVFNLFAKDLFPLSCFDDHVNGVWLADDGKNILIPAYTEMMSIKIDYKGKRLSKANHIFADAQRFASRMKQFYLSKNKNADKYGSTDML